MPVLSTPGELVDGYSNDAPTFAPIWRSCPHRHSVIVTTAAFVVAYTALLIKGVKPPFPDVVFTMWPSVSWASNVGTKELMPFTTPITLTSSDHRQSLTWCSQMGPSEPDPMPALLHTTWTAPYAS